jgi:hypothetical protein
VFFGTLKPMGIAENAAVKGRTALNIVLFLFLTTGKSFPSLDQWGVALPYSSG